MNTLAKITAQISSHCSKPVREPEAAHAKASKAKQSAMHTGCSQERCDSKASQRGSSKTVSAKPMAVKVAN